MAASTTPLASAVAITLTPGPVVSLALLAEPSELVADGLAQAELTATALDTTDVPVPRTSIAFTASGLGTSLDEMATTDEAGIARTWLTAGDRPYKSAMKLSRALAILGRLKTDNHVDPDIFDVFIRRKVYLEYARRFLESEQIDDVDVREIPGYEPTPEELAESAG